MVFFVDSENRIRYTCFAVNSMWFAVMIILVLHGDEVFAGFGGHMIMSVFS